MAKNRYKGERKTFIGQMKVLSTDNPFIKKVEIDALNDKTNRNNWRYINLDKHLPKFRNIPLLTAYLPTGKIGDGHNSDVKRDPYTGEAYQSYTAADAERIVGWVPETASVKLVTKDGVNWVRVEAALWAWYARELVSQIVRQGDDDPMEVSIETLIRDEYMENGVAVETEYEILGITILGKGVAPAVAGASLKTLADLTAMRDGAKELILKAASYAEPATTTNNSKGVKAKMTYFSKKQLAELGKRFEGYQVLSAAQDEKGIYVCLMSNEGDIATYAMKELSETIATEKIIKANPMASFKFEENSVEIGVSDITDELSAKLVKANSELEKAQEELRQANNTIKDMKDAEDKRRVNAAKAMAQSTLEAFNANRESKVDAKCLEAINSDIEAGKFTACMANGEWNGEEAVKEKVLAACASAQIELDKANAAKRNSTFVWEKLGTKEKRTDSVGSILEANGIR